MAGDDNDNSLPQSPDTISALALAGEIGAVAVRLHVLTPDQVEQALAARREKSLDDAHDPGLVFVEEGLLTRSQLDYLETVRRFKAERIADKRFGELAVRRGWTTDSEVNAAMEVQKLLFTRERKQVQIGDMLVRRHAITAEQRDILLTVQHRARQERAQQTAAVPAVSPVPAPAPAAPTPLQGDTETSAAAAVAAPLAAEASVAAATPAEAASPPARERHVPKGFKVTVSEDHMAAYVTVQSGGERPTDEALRAALHVSNVARGVDEAALQRLCAEDAPLDEPVQVAQGERPQPGVAATIEYLFELHPLKAGRETGDDTIDFRDRGDIPQVNPGDVLARKTPAVEGHPGKDVHGRTIKVPKIKDRRLGAGSGTQLGPDNLTVVAALAGHPALTPSGVVSVFPEYRIDGDLGYATGHVDFNGRVIVSGMVEPGFHVKCGELIANEVEGAEIEATGDVVIKGGVIGARIRTDGSVRAKYFHTSHIDALGDVIVQSELFDSEVETSGTFHGDHCTLLGSRVSAKSGVVAGEIGSNSSPPCVITIGVDERVQHKVEQLEAAIAAAETALSAADDEMATLTHLRDELDGRIGAMAQVQDKAQVQQRALEAKTAAGDSLATAQLQLVEEQIKSAATDLDALFARQDEVNNTIDALARQQVEQRASIDDNRAEITGLHEWTQESSGKAELKVAKTTFQGNVVRAPHGEMRLNEDKKRLWIIEQEVTDERGQTSWRFVHQS